MSDLDSPRAHDDPTARKDDGKAREATPEGAATDTPGSAAPTAPPTVIDLPLGEIRVGKRLRPLGDVSALVASIRAVGLSQPIVVTSHRVLVAGAHRLEACRQLGMATIQAVVRELNETQAQLAELDENLVRRELTALERAEHLARRKTLYEALYPSTRVGGAPGKAGGGKVAAKGPESGSFVDKTAASLGLGRSTVAECVKIGAMPAEVRDAVRGTPAANVQSELLLLARQPAEVQKAVAKKIKNGAVTSVRTEVKCIATSANDAKKGSARKTRDNPRGKSPPNDAGRLPENEVRAWLRAYADTAPLEEVTHLYRTLKPAHDASAPDRLNAMMGSWSKLLLDRLKVAYDPGWDTQRLWDTANAHLSLIRVRHDTEVATEQSRKLLDSLPLVAPPMSSPSAGGPPTTYACP